MVEVLNYHEQVQVRTAPEGSKYTVVNVIVFQNIMTTYIIYFWCTRGTYTTALTLSGFWGTSGTDTTYA